MKRILFSLALVLSLTIGVVPNANADTVTFPCGGTATYSVLMPQGVLLDGKNCSGSLTIDKSVQIIGAKAFFGNQNIYSVVIPDGVKLIDEQAFFSNRELRSITIPNSVTTINSSAFAFTGLTSLTLPNALTRISSQTFRNTKISSLIIPPSVTIIEYSAFSEVPLTSLVIPNTVTEIGGNAFEQSKLVSVTIPDSVRVLGYSVFKDNTSLTSISLPDGLSQIGLPAFAGNYALTAIYFCGSFPSGTFPINQTCPPERQAVINAAKAAADKVIADAAAKAAADKVIADKAAADAKAATDKAAADAKAATDKAAADAKAATDKAAAEANRREQTISASPLISGPIPLSASGLPIKVSSTSNLPVFTYNNTDNVCEFANGLIKTKTSGRCVIAFSQEGNSDFKPATNFILDFSIVSAAKPTTITCIKGKLTKKVTAVKPVCPSGYKKK